MIPYYSPNLDIKTIVKVPFVFNAAKKIQKYYREHTGKRYILITNSCRTALYLSYKTLNKSGEVITSPLTCKVAIDPIIESNNIPVYIDINPDTLNMAENLIEANITGDTIAIQVIHFGGVACNMKKIIEVSQKYNIPVIEDCAQGFRAKFEGIMVGTIGDISCFSMIKNAYGIGGGILATNNKHIYESARKELAKNNRTPIILSIYRIFRNLLESNRGIKIFDLLYKILLKFRGNYSGFNSIKEYIKKPNQLELKVNYLQLLKSKKLLTKRIAIAEYFIIQLHALKLMTNYQNNKRRVNVYTKLFIYKDKYNSKKDIIKLNNSGIEATHLEQKYDCYFQEKLTKQKQISNYQKIHDSIISIPLYENLTTENIDRIIEKLKML